MADEKTEKVPEMYGTERGDWERKMRYDKVDLDHRTARARNQMPLSEKDTKLLAIKLMHPAWTNVHIAAEVGVSRVSVWKAFNREPLKSLLISFQEEMLETAKGAIIAGAVDAVHTLSALSRGEDPRGQFDFTIPHAVMRQASKDLLELLKGHKLNEGDDGEEVWEAAINEVGIVTTRKQKALPPATPGEDEEEMEVEDER
jgi:hypothetical protein